MERRSNLVLGALALGLSIGAADPATAQTCFGQTPTIVGAGKIKGTKGNDVILGSAFAHDQIDGGGGADVICGLDGDDTIKVKGRATVDGGPGNDRIMVRTGGGGSNNVQGGSGDDVISFSSGGGGSNTVNGGEGDDTIKFNSGGGGGNTVDGGLGTDTCKAKGADPVCEIVD